MSAFPPAQTSAMRETVAQANQPLGSLAKRWEELHETAAQLAKVANLGPETATPEIASLPAMLGDAAEWQREMAWQGIEDIDAIMRPGLTALHVLSERGQDASAPALALWREFHHARGAVISLLKPDIHD